MKTVDKQIERDCVRQMWPCFVLHFLWELMRLTIPVITSWMIGDMADALLTLDMNRVKGGLAVFLLALALDVFVLNAVILWENLSLTRRGFQYGTQMFGRYLRLPMSKAREIDAATMVQRVDYDTTEYYFLLMYKWAYPPAMAIYLVVLAVMLVTERFHPLFVLAMAALAAIPILRAAVNGRQKAKLKQAKLNYEEARKGMEFGMFSARDFLRGFGLSERYISRMRRQFEKYAEKTGSAQDKKDGADAMFSYLCTYGVPLGVIAVGALLIAGGSMGMGALLAGYLIMPSITRFYRYFEELVLNSRKEGLIRSRLAIFYAGRDGEGETADLRELRLDDVTFTYPGGEKPVFEHRSLTIPLSGRLHITGPNGAGKSTLLALLSGVCAPDDGAVTDESGRQLDCGALRFAVSLQEQDGQIFAATVGENLFLPEERLSKAEAMLRDMGFEKTLDTVLEEDGGNLSPGERKKILLTRALMKSAPVLALDEPLNHLDARGAETLTKLLAEEKRPILLVSHTPLEGLDWDMLEL